MSSLSAEARALARRIATGGAYRRLFASPDGQVVLRDLLEQGGVLHTSQGDTAEQTAFNEGRRSMALLLLDRLRWTAADVVRMAGERVGFVGGNPNEQEE